MVFMIGRPYHSDPGLNHSVLEEFQVLGYPILSMRSIPKDEEWLKRFFQEDLDQKRIETPLEIRDVWPENYSANSAMKVWAAKFASRHPHVVVLDLSSFKCGHDAPTYGIIDGIISTSASPSSGLNDIDPKAPAGSIKSRVRTYAHALKLHEERLDDSARKKHELHYRLDVKRVELLELKKQQLAARRVNDPAVEKQIEEIKARVHTYEAARRVVDAPPVKGLVTLGIKKSDKIERLGA